MGRYWRIRIAAGVACLAAIAAVIAAYLHPSAMFYGDNVEGYLGYVTHSCISPWDKWHGHYSSVIAGPLGSGVQALGVTACKAAIVSRQHFVFLFAGIVVVALLVALSTAYVPTEYPEEKLSLDN